MAARRALFPGRPEALGQKGLPDAADHLGAIVATPAFTDPGAVTHLGERRTQVSHMGCLVGADVRDQPGGLPSPATRSGVGHPFLGPGEGVEGGDLNEQHADHQRDHHLELRRDVVGQERGPPRPRAGRVRIPCGPAWPRCRARHWTLERDVTRGEPHVAVPGLLVPPRLVTSVRLEEATAEMVDGRAADVLDEVTLQVLRLEQPDVRPVALDRPDAGQRRHERLGHARLDEEPGLGDVRKRALPPLERDVDELGRERAQFCSPHAATAGTRNRVRGDT